MTHAVKLQRSQTSPGWMLLRYQPHLLLMLRTFIVCKKVEICFAVSDFIFLVQIVLEEAGRPMHIKEIKQRIIDRGLVQSKYIKPNISLLTR